VKIAVPILNRSIKVLLDPNCKENPVTAPQHSRPAPRETAERLLAAAERIVLREGAHAVSIRRIATLSGQNSALVSYHFGGIESLLGQLLERNVGAICDAREMLLAKASKDRSNKRLHALVVAYIDPLWRTPAIWHPESARTVVREVMPMLERPLLRQAVARINSSVELSASQLSDLLPHLQRDQLLVRLRLLAGAADMMRLSLDAMGLYPLHKIDATRQLQVLHKQLVAMCLGALRPA
jgi:AcrR family transcriptional regulator